MTTLTIPNGIEGETIEGSPMASKVRVLTIFLEDLNGIGMKAVLFSDGVTESKVYRDASWTNEDIIAHVEQRQEKYQEILNYKK